MSLTHKWDTQVVVPFLTEHYGAQRDPQEKGIPVCTLKHFPNKIEHTVQWAVDWFEGELHQAPELVNKFLSDADFLSQMERNQAAKLGQMRKVCVASSPLSPRFSF